MNPATRPSAVARDDEHRLVLLGPAEPVERHREPALLRPAAPGVRHHLELVEQRVRRRVHLHQLGRVPRLLQAVHRLAHLADGPALQRELGRRDDRLVADVERPKALRHAPVAQLAARADHGEAQVVAVGPVHGLGHERAHLGRLADGVAGHQQHPVLDPVADERGACRVPEVLLVGAQLEEAEGVVAVLGHDLAGELALVVAGQLGRGRQRAKRRPDDHHERAQREHADGLRHVAKLIPERDRRGLPEEHRAARVHDRVEARAARRGGVGGDGAQDERRGEHQPRGDQRRPQPQLRRGGSEAPAAPPEQPRGRPREQRLLHVEALQEVQEPEHDEQREGHHERAAAAAPEVVRGQEQRGAGGDHHCVEDGGGVHRGDVGDHVAAPRDVGRERRDQRGDGRCRDDDGRKRRHPVSPARGPKRHRRAVQAQRPGSGVAPRGGDVAPVLEDRPEADERQRVGEEAAGEDVGHVERKEHREDAHAEVPLVDAAAEDEDPRAERVLFNADHRSLVNSPARDAVTRFASRPHWARPGDVFAPLHSARRRWHPR